MEKQYALCEKKKKTVNRQNDKKLKKVTHESETDLNFSRERPKHAFDSL